MLENTFARAAFAVTLLSGNPYTWYTTQQYTIGAGHAKKLIWEHLKSDLRTNFKPLDYVY